MATAGYSGTPLPKKLGITPGCRLAIVGAPDDFDRTLGLVEPDPVEAELLDGVRVARSARGSHDVVVAFFTERRRFERSLPGLERSIFPAGGLWIVWPKKASGVPTDIGEDTIRKVALPRGIVDNKVCAIDATWSGLRLVWRKELRR